MNTKETVTDEKQANLGLATTRELISELNARADVAATVGEEWPDYKTVGGEAARASG